MRRVFADTSYFIAVIAPNDVAHERAEAFANEPLRLVTTAWIMSELAAYLSATSNRSLFNALLLQLQSSSAVDFIEANQGAFRPWRGTLRRQTRQAMESGRLHFRRRYAARRTV